MCIQLKVRRQPRIAEKMTAMERRVSRASKQPKRKETAVRKRREAVVNLRMSLLVRDLIDNAAAVLGKTRTDFIVETSRKHAIDVLLDQRLFSMTAEQYDSFLAVLDVPPAPNEKLKRLFASKSRWET